MKALSELKKRRCMEMMRKLTMEEIERFASRPDVKRVAVENFLSTVHNNENSEVALKNLELDVGLYGWNRETISVIIEGIFLARKSVLLF